MNKIRYFFQTFIPEVITEMKKVTYPSRDEVVGTTGVVLIASFIFAAYLWAADVVIVRLYELIFDVATNLLG